MKSTRIGRVWILTVGRAQVIMAAVAILAVVGGAVFFNYLAGPPPVMTTMGPQPVRRGDSAQAAVSLMFNVDWGEDVIPALLEILEDSGARVTFFVTGTWARKNPQMLRLMYGQGHEIALHGDEHAHILKLSDKDLSTLISQNAETVKKIIDVPPARLFAPPYGEVNERVVKVAADLGYATIMWTHDTVDWKKPPASTIVKRVVGRAESGALFLMHPTAPTTEALPTILRGLKAAGYQVAPVSQLLPPTTKPTR